MSTWACGCAGNVLAAALPPAGVQPCRRKGAANATQTKTLRVPGEKNPSPVPSGPQTEAVCEASSCTGVAEHLPTTHSGEAFSVAWEEDKSRGASPGTRSYEQ